MPDFCIVGSSTLLQKSLPHFLSLFPKQVLAVFLQLDSDTEAIKLCKEQGLEYFDISELKNGNTALLNKYQADYLFNINSTLILSPEQLSISRIANLNLHPGKLPEYAGMHTHQWAIRNGETQFGVTLHYMQAGIDTGNIALQSVFDISVKETGLSLFLKCMQQGAGLVRDALDIIASGNSLPSITQDHSHRKLYTRRMAQEAYIDLQGTSEQALRLIRAADYAPFKSPTYTPQLKLRNHTVQCVKASRAENPPRFDGSFFYIPEQGLYIAFSDSVILITRILDEQGQKIPSEILNQWITA